MDNEVKEEVKEDLKHIVRIANTDLDGHKSVHYALTGIKGVGIRAARIIADCAGIDPNTTIGYLPNADIDKLKEIVESIDSNLPYWMLNRQKDLLTGENKHIIGTDLLLTLREDINIMKKIRCYKGIRHERGHKVRGQRTRSTGRKGAVVGVSRKAAKKQSQKKQKERQK
ncbi:MAG: 30S ribosomal protein S13 [Methanosarcinales archaeon]